MYKLVILAHYENGAHFSMLAWPQSAHVARAMTSNMPSVVRKAGCPSTHMTTSLMSEVSTNIETEPQLQPRSLSVESLSRQSAYAQDDSRVDI